MRLIPLLGILLLILCFWYFLPFLLFMLVGGVILIAAGTLVAMAAHSLWRWIAG